MKLSIINIMIFKILQNNKRSVVKTQGENLNQTQFK